jgi:hypothetical protein
MHVRTERARLVAAGNLVEDLGREYELEQRTDNLPRWVRAMANYKGVLSERGMLQPLSQPPVGFTQHNRDAGQTALNIFLASDEDPDQAVAALKQLAENDPDFSMSVGRWLRREIRRTAECYRINRSTASDPGVASPAATPVLAPSLLEPDAEHPTNEVGYMAPAAPAGSTVPLPISLCPEDLRAAAGIARMYVGYSEDMLSAAWLPENDLQRDEKLFEAAVDAIAVVSGHRLVFTARVPKWMGTGPIQPLLAEFEEARRQAGTSLPSIWGKDAGSAVELAVRLLEWALAWYCHPPSDADNLPALRGCRLPLKGCQPEVFERSRRRLRSLSRFNAERLCNLIDEEAGIAARLRLAAAQGTNSGTTPTPPASITHIDQSTHFHASVQGSNIVAHKGKIIDSAASSNSGEAGTVNG